MAALVILFGNTDYVKDLISSKGGGNVIIFVIVFVGINALFEMVASTVVSTAVGSSLLNAKLIKDVHVNCRFGKTFKESVK